MKNKRNLLLCLIILLTGVIYFAVQAQQKNDTHRANFSGEWKSKESICKFRINLTPPFRFIFTP